MEYSDEEFDRLFERLLDELNIKSKEVRKEMSNYSKERKATLLIQNLRQQVQHQAQLSATSTFGSADRLQRFPSSTSVLSPSSPFLMSPNSADYKSGGLLSGLLGKNQPLEKTPLFYIEKLNNG
jgi:hypothetical protein